MAIELYKDAEIRIGGAGKNSEKVYLTQFCTN